MASRRHWHLSFLSAIVGAALLAACGGGDSELNVGKVVSFGDSLSDLGAYSPTSSIPRTGAAPYFGGRWTTNTHTGYTAASNSNTATIWVEWVAARVGVPITVAEVGFAGQSVKCPAAANPALAGSCTAYGMGGALVTDPNGIRHSEGALTVPLVTQVANHLARFGNFAADDIVFVWAGDNEAFVNADAVGAGLPPATAIANMQTAANELVALVKDQIVAKGAKRVAVMNAIDLAITPGGSAQPAPVRGLLTQLVAAFNTTVAAGLANVDVRIIDVNGHLAAVVANPSTYGFTNVTTAACDPAKILAVTGGAVTDGASPWCNAAPAAAFTAAGLPNLNTLKTGASASTWLFADSNHPTTGGHKTTADFVITNIKEFGWIPSNL